MFKTIDVLIRCLFIYILIAFLFLILIEEDKPTVRKATIQKKSFQGGLVDISSSSIISKRKGGGKSRKKGEEEEEGMINTMFNPCYSPPVFRIPLSILPDQYAYGHYAGFFIIYPSE